MTLAERHSLADARDRCVERYPSPLAWSFFSKYLFLAHFLGQRDDAPVPLDGTREGEADAGVARCRLDQGVSGLGDATHKINGNKEGKKNVRENLAEKGPGAGWGKSEMAYTCFLSPINKGT